MTSQDLAGSQTNITRTQVGGVASSPIAWLAAALIGVILLFAGIAIEVYRHEHGADAADLVSWSNPGVIVAFAGIVLAAIGLLAALSAVVLQSAGSAETVISRGAVLVGVWTLAVASGVGAITYAATANLTIGHEGHASEQHATTPLPIASGDQPPGAQQRATLSGAATLDGAPLETEFLGVRVQRDGFSTACQQTIPAVSGGQYQIGVVADAEIRGCGAPGAQILLWAFVNDTFMYSTQSVPWPGDGGALVFDASFSSDDPAGASIPVAAFKGELFDRDGKRLQGGTVIEAFVGDTRCGVTSLPYRDTEENLYTLAVAGPESIEGCTRDATLTFRLNGAPAAETAANSLTRNENDVLNLTLR